MNFSIRAADRLVIRLINYGILLHASVCIGAIGMLALAPFALIGFHDDIQLANRLVAEPRAVVVPLVNRSRELRDSQTGKYLCYVELPTSAEADGSIRFATPYLRSSPVAGVDSLEIFGDSELIGPSTSLPRIIEVPADRTWSSIFRAVRGRSIGSAIAILFLQFLLWLAMTYFAVRGYFLIKYGRRKRSICRVRR